MALTQPDNRKGATGKAKTHTLQQPTAQQRLVELLRNGLSVITPLWTYSAQDWVTSVHAADIDNDGDIEILLGSRDGHVYVLTKWGSLKWQTRLGDGQWVSTVVGVTLQTDVTTQSSSPRVLAGSRDGKVYALDQNGRVLPEWTYQTGGVIRQIFISPCQSTTVLVASEDRSLHALAYDTGQPLWTYATEGRVQCVFSFDVDCDGEPEILAGSADKKVYVLDRNGQLKGSFCSDYKITALFAAPLQPNGPITILTSANGKDLCGWTLTEPPQSDGELIFKKTWPGNGKHPMFENRVHSIFVTPLETSGDANDTKNPLPKILVGSEDHHLYILDEQGNLLWKYDARNSIYSIYAIDMNYDGSVEVLMSAAEQLHVLHIELIPSLYDDIHKMYKAVGRKRMQSLASQNPNQTELIYALLRDLVNSEERKPTLKVALAHAELAIAERSYERALAILLLLQQQHVQHYWEHARTDLGHIRALDFGDVAGDPKDEILIGNTEGELITLDIEKEEQIWKQKLGSRVLVAQMGTTDLNTYDTVLAVLEDRRVCAFDSQGKHLQTFTFPDPLDRILCLHINAQGAHDKHEMREIILGLENNKIYIYDATLSQLRQTITTPHGIKILATHDLQGDGTADIVAGGVDNTIYVYNRQGEVRWRYQTNGSIQAVCIKDIDGDGKDEILVGSEDRYAYVLDLESGYLKWSYYTSHRVLAVEALDIDGDGRCEVLVGAADGNMYVLNSDGDLLWTYKANDRIRGLIARDMNADGVIEIVVASEDRLSLLQVVDQKKVRELIQKCWQELLKFKDFKDPKRATRLLIDHENEYVRAMALRRLAGMPNLADEDHKRIQEALKDSSLTVKKELSHAIMSLFLAGRDNQENIRQMRHLLQQLSTAPELEVRLAIIAMLPALTQFDATICFEYLERFTNNVDPAIRRAVVRKLHRLAEEYPQQTFRLLLKTVKDPHPWIRQESGRAIARYLDLHFKQELVIRLHDLFMQGVDPDVLLLIAHNAREPVVKQLFHLANKLITSLKEEDVQETLQEVVETLQLVRDLEVPYGADTLFLYQELHALLTTRDVDHIEEFQRITTTEDLKQFRRFIYVADVLERLEEIVSALKIYRRREALGDRAASLIEATTVIHDIIMDLQTETLRMRQGVDATPHMPEYTILDILLQRWFKVVLKELRRLRGYARLKPELQTQTFRQDDLLEVALVITNEGRSPADNVRVILESNPDFGVVGENERYLDEVSTLKPATLPFTIRPHTDHPRLSFSIFYDDAERAEKHTEYADRLELKSFHYTFRDIPNPYNSGTPIRGKTMFFGRKEDLDFLKEQLTSTSANRVVVLTGQRRSGKTSLIYQLANDASLLNPHVPVFIDLQAFALKPNINQLLAGIATAICDILKERGINAPRLEVHDFAVDPTAVFSTYLENVTRLLTGNRLVLLIDEFETLEQKITEKQIDAQILQYLRSLMQHRQGINFLLAGAPGMRHMTEDYWSVFFNIAQHLTLSKLKPEDAELLITLPVKDTLQYDALALEKMHQLTGDQPYLIHIMAETLIRNCNKQHKNYVTTNDVLKTLTSVLEKGVNHFGWLWNQSTPLERFLLSALAQEKGKEGRFFSVGDLKEVFDDLEMPFEREEVLNALTHLVREDIVEERQNGTQFRIPVGLTRAWLHETKPPERVVREENLTTG